ncbi:RNA 3'-terminal phosphate cyclase [Candidatus Woesearchaeota archaeon]|nr:RNA 3'-terminal phosphate cyclase [Candidatus Woesearchaeota archaeon]
MIKIDGSVLEGGGQIVRTALSLSSLTKMPFKVSNIRKGREKPGLKNQHLYAIRALKEICEAKIQGDELASTELLYVPQSLKGGKIDINIQTAGSITLVLQAILMPLMFADKNSTVTITGGTDTKWSQPIDFLKHVLLPQLKKYCSDIEIKVMRRGYYPKGQGKVIVEIKPKYHLKNFQSFEEIQRKIYEEIPHINLTEQGELVQIKGISHASADLMNAKVAERQAESAKEELKKIYSTSIDINAEYTQTESTGSGITLWAIFAKNRDVDPNNPVILGADELGEKGKPAENIGKQAAEKLMKEIESKSPVDQLMADNLVPWLIFGGQFRGSDITLHAKTNVWVVNQFFKDKLEIIEEEKLILSH